MGFFARLLFVSIVSLVAHDAAAETEILPDVVYGHKDGMALTYDVCLPESSQRNGAGVLLIISGAWISRWVDPEIMLSPLNPLTAPFRELIDRGYVIYFLRHGSAPRYKVPDAVADVKRAVAHIRKSAPDLGVDPDRLGVTGMSAGGHLSLVLGTMGQSREDGSTRRQPPVAAVVAWFPPTDLIPYMDGTSEFEAFDFEKSKARAISPRYHVDACDASVLLLHGDADRLVPLEHSEEMKKALEEKGVPVELVVFPGQKHGFTGGDGRRASQLMIDFFEEQIGSPPESPE
jgi:acetyl esterase/lipase